MPDEELLAAKAIYRELSKVTPHSLETAYSLGLIRKEDLVVGAMYWGICRNSDTAIWKDNGKFEYCRTKFGTSYMEEIPCPEDDEGFDIFVAIKRLSN